MRLFKEFPFATTFALAGFFVGLSILFSLDFFTSYDPSSISGNPAESLLNYLKESLAQAGKAILKGVMLGLTLGLIFGVGGFVIDFLNKKSQSKVSYSKKTQEMMSSR